MRYLLDTHILLWWLRADDRLSAGHRAALEAEVTHQRPLAISVFTLWEIAMLASRGRMTVQGSLDRLIGDLETNPALSVLPLSARVVLDSLRLGEKFPRDPADHLIAATARTHGLTLVTADERIVNSGVVPILPD